MVETGLGAGDEPQVRVDAPTLKGSCLILGADALETVFARLADAEHELRAPARGRRGASRERQAHVGVTARAV